MKIQKAAVIGAGTMGAGIAQVLSSAGIEVLLKDVNQEFVDRGLNNIKKMYDSRVKKATLTQKEADFLFANIKGITNYSGFEDVDLVIEAALETIEVKRQIFMELDKICPPHAILASNTSALSISEIAACTNRTDKVLGMHFFNPAQFMKLVEVIPGVKTSKQTTEIILDLCKKLSKVPVKVEECPGFLVNRLLFPYLNESLYVLQENKISPQELDKACLEFGLPMGPFALLDMTGIDVCAHVTNYLYKEYGPRFEPNPLLDLLVEHKFLGQKTGAGFYQHDKNDLGKKDEIKTINPELNNLIAKANKLKPVSNTSSTTDLQEAALRVVMPMFNEAMYALQEKVVEVADIDVAMQFGCGLKRGLLTLAQEKGLEFCLNKLENWQINCGERFRPAWLLHKFVRANLHDLRSFCPEPVSLA